MLNCLCTSLHIDHRKFVVLRNYEGVGVSSTAEMGTGTNVQDKLIAVHDLDIPWRPADVGRILRTFKIKKNVEVTDNGKDNF